MEGQIERRKGGEWKNQAGTSLRDKQISTRLNVTT
jgi:hypothetical protein